MQTEAARVRHGLPPNWEARFSSCQSVPRCCRRIHQKVYLTHQHLRDCSTSIRRPSPHLEIPVPVALRWVSCFADIDKPVSQGKLRLVTGSNPSSHLPQATMASMSRFGTGLARSRLVDESTAFLRCPACLQRQALLQTSSRPRRQPLANRTRQVAAIGGGSRSYSQQSQQRPRFSSRLRMALGKSKTEWYFIPVGVGIGFLGLVQGYKVYSREKERQQDETQQDTKPKKRPRIRPDGPW